MVHCLSRSVEKSLMGIDEQNGHRLIFVDHRLDWTTEQLCIPLKSSPSYSRIVEKEGNGYQ
jgi:hypothetical protein